MNILGSFVEIDGLRAIISSISSQVTDDTVVIKYIMVDVAEDDITTVVLNNVKFDMFKWFHHIDFIPFVPTKHMF
jgi:hypothetical protein